MPADGAPYLNDHMLLGEPFLFSLQQRYSHESGELSSYATDFYVQFYNRFTCPEKAVLFSSSFRAVLFFLLTQGEKKGFQPIKSLYFCVGQQKRKELLKKNH